MDEKFARKKDKDGNFIKQLDKDGKVVMGPIPAFTIISHDDVKNGLYVPKCFGSAEENKKLKDHCLWYTKELDKKGRFLLCIWPEHCRIGTKGQAIVPPLNAALTEWCKLTGRSLNFVNKTESHMTEMYSALEAEVVLPDDETTMLNKPLLSRLQIADQVSFPLVLVFYFSFSYICSTSVCCSSLFAVKRNPTV